MTRSIFLSLPVKDMQVEDHKPSPPASPEDLAAIAALEAGHDYVVPVQQLRPATLPGERAQLSLCIQCLSSASALGRGCTALGVWLLGCGCALLTAHSLCCVQAMPFPRPRLQRRHRTC